MSKLTLEQSGNNSVYKHSIREISQPLQGHQNKGMFMSHNPSKSTINYFRAVWGVKGVVWGRCSWKCQKGGGKKTPNKLQTWAAATLLHPSLHHVWKLPCDHIWPHSLGGFTATTFSHHVDQWYCTAVRRCYLSLVGSPTRCSWESGAHSCAGYSAGCVSRHGGVFAEESGWVGGGPVRDRSHRRQAAPEWCCSAPSSTLSTANEKFPTSSEVTVESGNVFLPPLCPIFGQ